MLKTESEHKLRITPRVALEEKELWSCFQSLTNEMIVTKSGRRMFPVVKVTVGGLDPAAMYSLLLEFVQIDQHRWKYVNGEWVAGGKPEAAPSSAVYIHSDSPNFGSHWMRDPVSFAKVKLTNKTNGSGQIMLNSLHKYEPRLHVIQVGGEHRPLSCHAFPECQFIAVTAYQNEEVTALKIKHNPFAKAFLDTKERPDLHPSRDLVAHYPQHHHQQYGWYVGGGGVAYGQAPPLAPPTVSLSSRLAANMRQHRVVPYTSPTPRTTRTPPVSMTGQQQGYGLGGLAGEWRQQPWPAHHHHHCHHPHPAHQPHTSTPTTPATPAPAHYQWSGLQGGYGQGGAVLYQGYSYPESGVAQDLTPVAPYTHNLAHTPPAQVYTPARPSDTLHGLGNEGLYSGRLHQTSPDHLSGGGGSPQSGGSPVGGSQAAAAATHTDMFILPDLTFPPGPPASIVKGEGLHDPLASYTSPSPHPWSPLSPPATCM